MRKIYQPSRNMIKACVHLLDIQNGSIEQHSLSLEKSENDGSVLMTTLDRLNQRFGRGTV